MTAAEALKTAAAHIRQNPEAFEPRFGSVDLYDVLHTLSPGASTTGAFALLRKAVFGSTAAASLSDKLTRLAPHEVADLCDRAAAL